MALWRVDEAADFLGIRPKTLYEWVRQGRVPHRKIGFNVRFDPDELESWVASQSQGPEPAERTAVISAGHPDAHAEPGAKVTARDPEIIKEVQDLVAEAATTLRVLEREVGAELSFKRRQELSALADRLEAAGRDPGKAG
jgi:excisionase family DNA binding protein